MTRSSDRKMPTTPESLTGAVADGESAGGAGQGGDGGGGGEGGRGGGRRHPVHQELALPCLVLVLRALHFRRTGNEVYVN